MSNARSTAILEIVVYGVIILIAGAVFINAMGLPVSNREPLGSASIPQAVCVLIAFLCAILLLRAVATLRTTRADVPAKPSGAEAAPSYVRRYDLSLALFVLAIAFTVILQERWVKAEILTPTFLTAGILILNRFRPRSIIPSVVIGVVVGLATTYVFKNFFYIDLP